jgi:hypothetical protein
MKKAIFAALVLFLAVQAIVVAQPAPRPLYAAEVSYTYKSTELWRHLLGKGRCLYGKRQLQAGPRGL